MNISNIEIGKRICQLRKMKNYTQEQLASMLSVNDNTISPKHISSVERGVSGLSLELLIQICQIFECSLDFIVFGKSSDELGKHVPTDIQEIYRSNDKAEINLLNKYLGLYTEIHK